MYIAAHFSDLVQSQQEKVAGFNQFYGTKPLLLAKKRGHDKCVLPVSKMSTLKYNGVSSDVKNSDS